MKPTLSERQAAAILKSLGINPKFPRQVATPEGRKFMSNLEAVRRAFDEDVAAEIKEAQERAK